MIWFCVRRNGVAQRSGWLGNVGIHEIRAHLRAAPEEVVETCIVRDFKTVSTGKFSKVFVHRARGVIGLEILCRGETLRLTPTHMISANLSFERCLERFLAERKLERELFRADGILRAFSARQFLMFHKGGSSAELFRGSTTVNPSPASDENRSRDLANGIEHWMLANMSADGEMPYKYWPSRGTYSPADNAIRQFLATLSLTRHSKYRNDATLLEAAQRNLRYNLAKYFRNLGDGRGVIVDHGGAKLGASAIAGLAILESPDRAAFADELKMLAAGINSLAHDECGFRTFFFPAERDGENWNFYSGEAMLFWAEAIRRNMAFAPTLERCAKTFELCQERHYRKRNPAFIPWHTQACVALYAHTGWRNYARFAIEICDWLLPMQQWNGLPKDMRGRFYDPLRPEFGPPHAASTGAYLEGLADALALARALGQQTRSWVYRRAIERGLRSLRQLQFRDHRDTFYISKKPRVMGALRTEVYDNSVRIDSAAHALAATVKVLQPINLNTSRSG